MMSQQTNFFGDKDAKKKYLYFGEMFEAEIKNDQEKDERMFWQSWTF